jgi:hypothetical protein
MKIRNPRQISWNAKLWGVAIMLSVGGAWAETPASDNQLE